MPATKAGPVPPCSSPSGLPCHPYRSCSLASAFAQVDADPARFTALGDAARAAYQARHRAPQNLERLLEIYAYAVAHPVAGGVRVG